MAVRSSALYDISWLLRVTSKVSEQHSYLSLGQVKLILSELAVGQRDDDAGGPVTLGGSAAVIWVTRY